MESSQQLCTFRLGKLFLGVPVQDVQEVIRYQEMTRVPLASNVVRGLINLRGQIVTAIDLRRRLALRDRPADRLPMNDLPNLLRSHRSIRRYLPTPLDPALIEEVCADAVAGGW
jgi:chemotaxis signal transduction protein